MKVYHLFCIVLLLLLPCLLSQKWYESKVVVLEASSDILADPTNLDYNLSESADNFDALMSVGMQETRELVTILFSSVINGYKFVYIPSDKRSNTQEHWEIELLDEIDIEDRNLRSISQEIYKGVVSVIYRYNLTESQAAWLKSWESSDVFPGEGLGISYIDLFETKQAKIEALEDAIKIAVRDRLTTQIPNKPFKIEGLVKVDSQPFFTQSGGYYKAKAKVKIQIRSIIPHNF